VTPGGCRGVRGAVSRALTASNVVAGLQPAKPRRKPASLPDQRARIAQVANPGPRSLNPRFLPIKASRREPGGRRAVGLFPAPESPSNRPPPTRPKRDHHRSTITLHPPEAEAGGVHARYNTAMGFSQLIPPPEFAPPGIGHLSSTDRIRLWAQLVDEGDRFIYDGFRQRLGSDAAARQACLEWLDRRNAESTRAKIRMLQGRRPGGDDGE
jgi:hypothetical protein